MSGDLTEATVFYSWESDLPGKTTRNLIEGCLFTAIRQLGREDDLDVDPSLDRDTKGISGSPIILDTILGKIDNCTAFVADVSIINSAYVRRDPPARPTPNPNVLVELGYALKTLGWDRILPVCNDYYGPIDQLPFDIPERRVISYTLSEDPTPEEFKAGKEKLTAILKNRIKDILRLKREAILDIQLGDPDTEELFGHERECNLTLARFVNFPDFKFPPYRPYSGKFDVTAPVTNQEYYQEVGEYTLYTNLTQRLAFAITNKSPEPLLSPRLEIRINKVGVPLAAFDEDSFPPKPSTSWRPGGGRIALSRKELNRVQVKSAEEHVILRAELETIQSQRTAWTSCCFLGTAQAPSITLNCRIYADNLIRPFERDLTLKFNVSEQSRSLREWIDAGFQATSIDSPEPSDTEE